MSDTVTISSEEWARIQARIEKLEQALDLYNRAADRFMEKVRLGQAKSIQTFTDLKIARTFAYGLEEDH